MAESIGIKVKYLDASALVKLYLDEPGSNYFRDYFYKNTNFCVVQMTFYEALNVLKLRLFNKERERYQKAVNDLTINWWSKESGGNIKMIIEEIVLNNYKIIEIVSEIMRKYNIDFADAMQLYAILYGKFKHLALESKSVLITADKGMVKAAESNNIRVWNPEKSAKPEWLDN